jgi:pimeloyl-ACP methyl ester carboxylesterase
MIDSPERAGTDPDVVAPPRPVDRARFESHLDRSEFYPYPSPPRDVRVTLEERRSGVRLMCASFRSPLPSGDDANDRVELRLFMPEHRELRRPLVFVHGLGTAHHSTWDATPRLLATRGFPTLSVPLPHLCERGGQSRSGHVYMSTDGSVALPAYEQAVADIRGALDWLLEGSPYAGEGLPRPSVAGVSLGALIAVIAAGVEPRFEGLVTMLGGGDLDTIVFHGRYRTHVREELESAGIMPENRRNARLAYRDYLERVRRAPRTLDVRPDFHFFLFDPLSFAWHLREKPAYMMNGLFDPIIPRASARALWLELGCPSISWFYGTHWTGGPWRPYTISRLTTFLGGLEPGARRTPSSTAAEIELDSELASV